MELPFQIQEVLARIERAGFEAYVVGGCVRDFIMGKTPHDFDIAAGSPPRETERVFADCRVIETGIKHGTVTVLYKGFSTEITTFRVDGDYSDSRRPDSVEFSDSIADDLSRRDFTMNGIAYSPRTGFVDPFGGADDIRAGVIRCIGEPEKRFKEDALRIMRALRFSSVLGFAIADDTAAAARRLCPSLRKISAERLFSELKLLLCGRDVKRVLTEYSDILSAVLPSLKPMIGYDQGSRYHGSDLYEHTARAVEAAPPAAEMRLAMLFHDAGKPERRSVDENGECHYYGHAEASAAIADAELRRLKCDNALRERVVRIVRYHDIPVDTSPRYIKRQLSKHGPELFADIMNAHIADDSAKQDFCLERIPRIREVIAAAEEIANAAPCLSVNALAVTGHDLKEIMEPSPLMGEVLSRLLDEVLSESLPNEKSALMERARQLAEEKKSP